jgi:hypothetical protein
MRNLKGTLSTVVTTAIVVLSLALPVGFASANGPIPGFEKNSIALLYGKWQFNSTLGKAVVQSPIYRIAEGYVTVDFMADPKLGTTGNGNDCFLAYNYGISRVEHRDVSPTVKSGSPISGYRDWTIYLYAYNPTLFGRSKEKAVCKTTPARHPELFIHIGVWDYDYKDETRPNGPITGISWDQCDTDDEAMRRDQQRDYHEACFEQFRTLISQMPTLCDSQEFSAFACAVNSAVSGSSRPHSIPRKILSLCLKYGAHDELTSLVYRFGADKQHVELTYPTGHAIPSESFAAVYSLVVPNRRSAAVEVTFVRAGYSYIVYNARVAQALGGGNGGVQISRRGKVISEVLCNGNEEITDSLWGVIRGLHAIEKPDRPQ